MKIKLNTSIYDNWSSSFSIIEEWKWFNPLILQYCKVSFLVQAVLEISGDLINLFAFLSELLLDNNNNNTGMCPISIHLNNFYEIYSNAFSWETSWYYILFINHKNKLLFVGLINKNSLRPLLFAVMHFYDINGWSNFYVNIIAKIGLWPIFVNGFKYYKKLLHYLDMFCYV